MGNNADFSRRASRGSKNCQSKMRRLLGVAAISAIVLGIVWLLLGQQLISKLTAAPETAELPKSPSETMPAPTGEQPQATPAAPRHIEDFRMIDLDRGWYRYDDGVVMVTEDGALHWEEAGPDWTEPVTPGEEELVEPETSEAEARMPELTEIEAAYSELDPSRPVIFNGQAIDVKRVQAVSGRIGWVLAAEGSGLEMPLLVTADGGLSWHDKVTDELRAAMEEEKAQRERRAEEAALYHSPLLAMKPGSSWTLLPDTTHPGDVVLVRRGEPGELEWQGKTYQLQPYKAGYFTYLPIPRSLKPGTYSVGEAKLTVQEKTFKTQYLTVSEEMESMRRNTERIEADQKKINDARSRSAPTFLFDSEFVIPLEGRLSTPFGYTRYVNGKFSNAHMAIDIAAPQGTPVIAANDGVVALADDLYLTGLTVYLDHGMELFSQYAHLSELLVKDGDTVAKGDVIGLVGSTGFSTGPHLHFAFWAHNVQVNPNLFFDATPFQWLPKSTE